MGEARHKGLCVLLHHLEKLTEELLHQPIDLIDLIPGIKLHIESYLVIAACVKALSRLTNALRQRSLHKRMDILIAGVHRDRKPSLVQILQDPLKTLYDIIPVLLRKNALLCQHFHVGNAPSDVLTVKFLVKGKGFVKIVY